MTHPTREQIAEALWESARQEGDDPVWTWQYLTERADRDEGDYAEIRAEYYRSADAVLALFPQPAPSAEAVTTTTEYAYGALDAPDIIVPTGEDIDDLGTARYNAEEFWVDVLQRTVKRGPWQAVPVEADPSTICDVTPPS